MGLSFYDEPSLVEATSGLCFAGGSSSSDLGSLTIAEMGTHDQESIGDVRVDPTHAIKKSSDDIVGFQ
jgi:hypothetical protein